MATHQRPRARVEGWALQPLQSSCLVFPGGFKGTYSMGNLVSRERREPGRAAPTPPPPQAQPKDIPPGWKEQVRQEKHAPDGMHASG